MSAPLSPFGAYLRARRKGARLSLYQVGGAIGMDARHLSRVERGKARSPMAPEHLPTLARTIVGFDETHAGRLLRGEVEAPVERPAMADVIARLEALEKRATFAPPTPSLPENDALREVLREAMVSVYLYGNGHGKDLRGALFTIIRHVSPAARDLIDEVGETEAHSRMFGEDAP